MRIVLTFLISLLFFTACSEPEFVNPDKSSFIYFTPASKHIPEDEQVRVVLVAEPKRTDGLISCNVKDMDIREFFQLLSEESGMRFGIQNDLDFKVTLKVDDKPWKDVMWDIIEEFKLTPTFYESPEQVEVFRYIPQGKRIDWRTIFQIFGNLSFVGIVALLYTLAKRRVAPRILRGDKERLQEKDWWHAGEKKK
jgi:hypothetical protein